MILYLTHHPRLINIKEATNMENTLSRAYNRKRNTYKIGTTLAPAPSMYFTYDAAIKLV